MTHATPDNTVPSAAILPASNERGPTRAATNFLREKTERSLLSRRGGTERGENRSDQIYYTITQLHLSCQENFKNRGIFVRYVRLFRSNRRRRCSRERVDPVSKRIAWSRRFTREESAKKCPAAVLF